MKHPIAPHLKPVTGEKQSGKLFESAILEKLSGTSILVPVVLCLVIAAGFLGYAIYYTTIYPAIAVVCFIGGALSWTFLEYIIHRYVYHSRTRFEWLKKLQHYAHNIHHQYPRDYKRLAMPPLPAIILLSMIYGLFHLLFGVYALYAFPGFVTGYMAYIIIHYSIHRYSSPRLKALKILWTWHAFHHYKYPETMAFGVSTRIWDYVFGTAPL